MIHLYEIQGTRWKTYATGGGWNQNFSVNILTTGILRALEIFEHEYPGSVVHAVLKRDKTDKLIIDREGLEVEMQREEDR